MKRMRLQEGSGIWVTSAKMIDLHTHSTCSDGTLSPSELIRNAKELGITAISLCDHDTTDGIYEAQSQAKISGIMFIPGLEISAEFSPGTMHILGYFINPDYPELIEKLKEVRMARKERNPKIVDRLNALGMKVSMEEIASKARSGIIGRPHFAATLFEKGYVKTMQEAFDLYLAKGMPAYVAKFRLSPKDAIGIINDSDGIAVLAHPIQLKIEDRGILYDMIKQLVSFGLQGIEVYYQSHSKSDMDIYLSAAKEFHLLATGGSDFHGSNRPTISLGTGRGNLSVPEECVGNLVKSHDKCRC